MTRLFIFGIDGATPELIFGKWRDELPNIKKLMREGCYREVESSIPPLTCTAWTSFCTGKSSGDHGLFDYLYRKNHEYEASQLISAKDVKYKTFWQILSEKGKKSIILGVPLTWPIKPFDGYMITGFMIPGTDREFTYPSELKNEINKFLGKNYIIDIYNYKNFSKEELKEKVYEMTETQFEVIKYLIQKKEWDLFFAVLIGSDRINHNFWRFFDKKHRKYEPNSKFSDVLKDYYKYLDKKLGEILEILDGDTTVIVCSDHGITRMHSRINLSDWLIKESYLVLKDSVKECKLKSNMVDWKKTKVFATGCYHGQIFLNLKGREPEGIVKQKECNSLIQELKEKLKLIKGDDGKKLNTKVFLRKKDYDGEARDTAPEMIVYFDNLEYGCNTSNIGNKTLWSPLIASGTDDAVHSKKGIFIMKNGKDKGRKDDIRIEQISKIILNEIRRK